MTTDPKPLTAYTCPELAERCAQQSSSVNGADIAPNACYELFCRACIPPFDDIAWQAIYRQYARLVRYWLGQYASDDTMQDTFLRFFQAQKSPQIPFIARYSCMSAVVAYLKRCAIAARIAAWRAEKHQLTVETKSLEMYTDAPASLNAFSPVEASAYAALKARVYAGLKSDAERAVFELTYTCDCTPREIQAQHSALFSNVQAVYRVRENLLKRLRRDAELQDWWDSNV